MQHDLVGAINYSRLPWLLTRYIGVAMVTDVSSYSGVMEVTSQPSKLLGSLFPGSVQRILCNEIMNYIMG